jgi:hypothetical protein
MSSFFPPAPSSTDKLSEVKIDDEEEDNDQQDDTFQDWTENEGLR